MINMEQRNQKILWILLYINSGIHVAQYLTEYVPKEILEQKFMDSIEKAKVQLEQRKNIEDKE